jgi:hypothetical protein
LSRQEPKHLVKEAGRTLPLVIEKMGDQKEKYRQLAAQCLTSFWKVSPMEVERIVKNAGMVSKNPRMKEACLNWVLQVNAPVSYSLFNVIYGQKVLTIYLISRCIKKTEWLLKHSYLL